MAVHLFIAPAGAGKTQACIDRVRAATQERPLAPVWAVVPNGDQARAFRQRLAAAGGALGVEVATFHALYAEALRAGGQAYAELEGPLQHRVLRAVVDEAAGQGRLQHYAPLRDKPGFVRALRRLAQELKQARVQPSQLEAALAGEGPRLQELASLYAAYQRRLREGEWMDAEGLGWLATSALAHAPHLLAGWALVAVDGFDQFDRTQVAFLAELARQVGELWLTLTWSMGGERLAHRRFAQALERLQVGLGVQAEALPGAAVRLASPLAHLEAGLFEPEVPAAEPGKWPQCEVGRRPPTVPPPGGIGPAPETSRHDAMPLKADEPRSRTQIPPSGGRAAKGGTVGGPPPPGTGVDAERASCQPICPHGDRRIAFLEAPNRASEARAALRWAKERLVLDGLAPADVAILARDLEPYAPILAETAAEFGLPLALARGLPLAANPAVAALLGLLSLTRRDRSSASLPDGRFPLRETLEALRSPYFDWQAGQALGLEDEHVDALERAAQGGRVLGGLAEWREAVARPAPAGAEPDDEDEAGPAAGAADLAARFARFCERVTPPAAGTVAGYTAFVEGLIGDDPGPDGDPLDDDGVSLRMLGRIRGGPEGLVERDLAALRELKEALRGLVWAEAALGGGEPVAYERYLDELEGVVAASQYRVEAEPEGAIWAASAYDARGLSFRAVAILGLAEGEFPRAPALDPLLRESDRDLLVAQGLPLEPPPAGAEFTLFYEAATRARERALLTRPYLAEDGQPWEPSPFWEEALRLCAGGRIERVRAADGLPLAQAASWPEVVAAAGARVARGEPAALIEQEPEAAHLWERARHGAQVLTARLARAPEGPYEGDCAALAPALAARYSPRRPWSASRLEAYLGCPLGFFFAYALELPERPKADVGFDAAQLGTMYHAILEKVYGRAASPALDDLLAVLPAAAGEVLAAAPGELGFRPSRLWQEEQARMRADVENTLHALAACSQGWQPAGLELRFGVRPGDAPPQTVRAGEGGEFLLRGVIDRADRDGQGQVRLIDYKTSSTLITAADLLEGRRIQLALYAWAAQGVLALGTVAGGFYWHLRGAKRSSFTLEGMDGGPEGAMARAAEHAWRAVSGVWAGAFPPMPAGHGCPPYCRGKEFCWRYSP